MNKHQYLTTILIILSASVFRILPHPPNFTPLVGLTLFSASFFGNRFLAILIPISATWLSDLFLSNVIYSQYYDSFVWFPNHLIYSYASYVTIALLAYQFLKKIAINRVLIGAISASVIFYLISNFGVWNGGLLYPKTLYGLALTYYNGIPFLGYSLMGDLAFSSLFFGLAYWKKLALPFAKTN